MPAARFYLTNKLIQASKVCKITRNVFGKYVNSKLWKAYHTRFSTGVPGAFAKCAVRR
jgi:hypothetical protein